jgi:hypothetical protein
MTRLLKAINWLFNHPYIPVFFLLVLLYSACSKPPGKIGAEIQPEQSQLDVFYFTTNEVFAYSSPEDSIRTDEMAKNLLGSIMDPVFGSSVAGIYSQFNLSEVAPDFGENPVLDSLIFQLAYVGDSYGDTVTPLTVHVYEMMEGIDYLEDYYSNTNIPVGSTDYGNLEFIPNPHDSTVFLPPPNDTLNTDTITLAPMIRINLSANTTDLGDKFLNADTSVLKDNEAFIEFFKGLYVVTEPVTQGGSINYVNMLSGGPSSTRLIMYYHNDYGDSVSSRHSFQFIIGQFTPRFNKYEHDFTMAESEFKAQVIDGDTALGLQKFYAQGIAGVRSVIWLPDLHKTNELDVVAINEAKLVFTGFEEDPFNGAPPALGLVEMKGDGTYQPLIDDLEGPNFFDGTYNSSTNSYTFRITRHIQSLISDTTKPNSALYMYVKGQSSRPERMIFNGNQPLSDTTSSFRLEILYTLLD